MKPFFVWQNTLYESQIPNNEKQKASTSESLFFRWLMNEIGDFMCEYLNVQQPEARHIISSISFYKKYCRVISTHRSPLIYSAIVVFYLYYQSIKSFSDKTKGLHLVENMNNTSLKKKSTYPSLWTDNFLTKYSCSSLSLNMIYYILVFLYKQICSIKDIEFQANIWKLWDCKTALSSLRPLLVLHVSLHAGLSSSGALSLWFTMHLFNFWFGAA